MRHAFLERNHLVLIDYVPGSSGQLLCRLWSECDARLNYDDPRDVSAVGINQHPASKEIEFHTPIPKRTINWFLEQNQPATAAEYLCYLDQLAVNVHACAHRWIKGSTAQRFYEYGSVPVEDAVVIYGMHTWHQCLPLAEMQQSGHQVRCVTLQARTDRGLEYQAKRARICYPYPEQAWQAKIDQFNAKHSVDNLDLCTMIANRDSFNILSWLITQIGTNLREDKLNRAEQLLEIYYKEIADHV
jgi:hypothetical protein